MKELTYKKNLMKDLTAFRNELSGYIKDDYLKLIGEEKLNNLLEKEYE